MFLEDDFPCMVEIDGDLHLYKIMDLEKDLHSNNN